MVADAVTRASAMDPFDDADAALQLLSHAGLRIGVVTNSTSDGADRSLRGAQLRNRFDVVMGGDAVGVFKPNPDIYRRALAQLEVPADEVCLVAAHAWDLIGAKRQQLRTPWIARAERWFVPVVPAPDIWREDLRDVAKKIAAETRSGSL